MLGKGDELSTVMILSFRTDVPGQTVQTQIRLLQSDQGLHCLSFCPHRFDSVLYGRAIQFKFYNKCFGCPNISDGNWLDFHNRSSVRGN